MGQKSNAPSIFRMLSNSQSPCDAFVRWRVEEAGNPVSATWEDQDLIDSWIRYYESKQSHLGIFMVTGSKSVLAEQHPAKLRSGADKAKLLSSSDTSGFTFRGRFLDADQAAGSQKRIMSGRLGAEVDGIPSWVGDLLTRYGPRDNDLWRSRVPAAMSLPLYEPAQRVVHVGQAFAQRLNRAIEGYRANLGPADDIVVMALDSATPGRMAISFYRELTGSEYLDRLQEWHERHAWPQDFGRGLRFVHAPACPA